MTSIRVPIIIDRPGCVNTTIHVLYVHCECAGILNMREPYTCVWETCICYMYMYMYIPQLTLLTKYVHKITSK